jgi:hypothetical protein
MNDTTIVGYTPSAADGFSSVVSLHAHTCHSRESLSFLPGLMARVPLIGRLIEYQTLRYRRYYGKDLDFERAYWRPPMTARAVIDSEMRHTVGRLGLRPIVSLTDHDTIEGPQTLAGAPLPCEAPASFEWTVYFGDSCVHLGVHNLPPPEAPTIAVECAAITSRPDEGRLADMLDWLQELPATLVVLNHPLWDGRGIGTLQRTLLTGWLTRYGHFLHALEINGYRSWPENQEVAALARRFRLPLVSGGDRHARAPNVLLNLTRSRTFADFAGEIRRDRHSHIVVMPEYREHWLSRTLEAVAEVLGSDPSLATGRRWVSRVFHVTDDRGDLPVAHYWEGGEPLWLKCAVGFMCLIGAPQLRPARRLALAGEQEVGL